MKRRTSTNKMAGWLGQGSRFTVDPSRSQPRELEVYGAGLCPAVQVIRLMMMLFHVQTSCICLANKLFSCWNQLPRIFKNLKSFFLSSCNVILHVWTEITIYAKGKSAEKAIYCEIENLNAYKLRLRRCLHNARVVSTKFRCTNNEKKCLFLCKIFFSPMFFLVT